MREVTTFTIPGPLLGYRASRFGARKNGRWKGGHDDEYAAYKKTVEHLALAAGWRWRQPTFKAPVYVGVLIHCKVKLRIDWKNIVGAIEDALYPQDRYVLPFVAPSSLGVVLGFGREEAVVTVSDSTPLRPLGDISIKIQDEITNGQTGETPVIRRRGATP